MCHGFDNMLDDVICFSGGRDANGRDDARDEADVKLLPSDKEIFVFSISLRMRSARCINNTHKWRLIIINE
jgi:hypothetical protein